MTPRLKLPAYGKQLLNARRLGQHPLVVHVVYGEEWGSGERCGDGCEEHPRLAVKPSEFQPWTIDWHVITGCKVVVFEADLGLYRTKNFYELMGELGRFAGPVDVFAGIPMHLVAREFMKMYGTWPAWWPMETERLNEPRRNRWHEFYATRHKHRAEAAA